MRIMLKHKREKVGERKTLATPAHTHHKENEKLLESCASWPHREKLALLAAKRKLSRCKARGGNVSEKALGEMFPPRGLCRVLALASEIFITG